MTRENDRPAELERLIDRAAVSELIDRYARPFDDRAFAAGLPALFTSDARVELPPGGHSGLDGMDTFHESVMAPFGPTQHLFTNALVDISGDRAAFRANTHVTHIVLSGDGRPDPGNLFLAGGTLTGTAARVSGRWQFQGVTLDVIWRHGDFSPGPH